MIVHGGGGNGGTPWGLHDGPSCFHNHSLLNDIWSSIRTISTQKFYLLYIWSWCIYQLVHFMRLFVTNSISVVRFGTNLGKNPWYHIFQKECFGFFWKKTSPRFYKNDQFCHWFNSTKSTTQINQLWPQTKFSPNYFKFFHDKWTKMNSYVVLSRKMKQNENFVWQLFLLFTAILLESGNPEFSGSLFFVDSSSEVDLF